MHCGGRNLPQRGGEIPALGIIGPGRGGAHVGCRGPCGVLAERWRRHAEQGPVFYVTPRLPKGGQEPPSFFGLGIVGLGPCADRPVTPMPYLPRAAVVSGFGGFWQRNDERLGEPLETTAVLGRLSWICSA